MFLVSPGQYNYSDTATEIVTDIVCLARESASLGADLWVRRHPRQKEQDGFDYDLMKQEGLQQGVVWNLSDSQLSLTDELLNSDVAIIRKWSDAGVAALCVGIPLLGWMPRVGDPYSDMVLKLLPLQMSVGDRFGDAISRVNDAGSCDQIRMLQQQCLRSLMGDPAEDPFKRTVDVLKGLISN